MMATRLTFPLICSDKDQFDISQNYFNGLNKFKKKKKMHLKSSSVSNLAPKKCTVGVLIGAVFFQNIKRSISAYKNQYFLIPMNQYVNVLQQKRHFTDLFVLA
jgi:hypothetical protein